MTTNEAYQKYLLELQANGSTDNIQTTRGRFVINYNKAQNRLIEWLIERNNEDDNRYLQAIKILDKDLSKASSSENKDNFTLPSDYFDLLNLNAYASSEECGCEDQLFDTTEIKAENLNNYLTSADMNPSFKYRESIYLVSEDAITLYTDNFVFDTALLSYYRYPKQTQLQNKENPESALVNSQLEFDDKVIDRIITLASAISSLNDNDPKYTSLKQEVLQKL
jgi:hypothetical protein